MMHLPALSHLLALTLLSTSARPLAEGRAPAGDDSVEKEGGETKGKKEDPSKCVTHTKQARYVSGYDHLVHVKNGCSKRVTCEVSTDVNPKKLSVQVEPGKTETVLTFRGSPASSFQATVDCRFDGTTK